MNVVLEYYERLPASLIWQQKKVNANEHNNKGRSIILDRWKADVKLCGLKTESDPMKGETDIDTS